MAVYQGRFLIARAAEEDTWAEADGARIRILRGKVTEPEKGRLLLVLATDQVQRLAAWAEPANLLVPLTGLLAREVRDLAAQLRLTPENFAVEAVNAFIQAGEQSGHGHGPTSGRPAEAGPQEIRFQERAP